MTVAPVGISATRDLGLIASGHGDVPLVQLRCWPSPMDTLAPTPRYRCRGAYTRRSAEMIELHREVAMLRRAARRAIAAVL
jgi:hypothetical protein